MRATFVNICRDLSPPFVNHDRLMDDRPKVNCLFLCFSFMPNDVPLRECGGGGTSFLHLCRIDFLRAICLVIHFLPFFGRIGKERGCLQSPPPCWVKEKLIQFPIKHVEFSFVASSSEAIHLDPRHPPLKSHRWRCIPCVGFKLSKCENIVSQR